MFNHKGLCQLRKTMLGRNISLLFIIAVTVCEKLYLIQVHNRPWHISVYTAGVSMTARITKINNSHSFQEVLEAGAHTNWSLAMSTIVPISQCFHSQDYQPMYCNLKRNLRGKLKAREISGSRSSALYVMDVRFCCTMGYSCWYNHTVAAFDNDVKQQLRISRCRTVTHTTVPLYTHTMH